MLNIRTTKTASKSIAVQVVRYLQGKTIIVKHIGSTKEINKVKLLKDQAEKFIQNYSGQFSLFKENNNANQNLILQSNYLQAIEVKHHFLKKLFDYLFKIFKFDSIDNPLLLDLVMMRIIKPSSKRYSIILLKDMFDIKYSETELYKALPNFCNLKDLIEQKIVSFAKKNLNFDFTILLYDVTTLYFESFKEDEEKLKQPGFSKDNKFHQPQIIIGLVVNKDGFPVSYDIYPGNTFEGHTIIPTILKFKKKYKVNNLTVVADAAMISFQNVQKLIENQINYIVGARVSNLSDIFIDKISSTLNKQDLANYRIKTNKGFLICDFSKKRYWKNKYEMEKQIKKAKNIILSDLKTSKNAKFVKNTKKTELTLNEKLIDKTNKLLGIKGYYTNLSNESNENIINYYHQLWNVEKSFRMAKSDLKTRPIYHYNNQSIHSHILICFMALAISSFLEIKTNKSLKQILYLTKKIIHVTLKDTITNQNVIIKPQLSTEIKNLISKIGFTY